MLMHDALFCGAPKFAEVRHSHARAVAACANLRVSRYGWYLSIDSVKAKGGDGCELSRHENPSAKNRHGYDGEARTGIYLRGCALLSRAGSSGVDGTRSQTESKSKSESKSSSGIEWIGIMGHGPRGRSPGARARARARHRLRGHILGRVQREVRAVDVQDHKAG